MNAPSTSRSVQNRRDSRSIEPMKRGVSSSSSSSKTKIHSELSSSSALSTESKNHEPAQQQSRSSSSSSSSTTTTSTSTLVSDLKRVLEREYSTFFHPMEKDWYSPTVTFDDPLTSIAGVQAYQANVDLLASRTLLGKILFQDVGIVLHSITGGEEHQQSTITTTSGPTVTFADIVTRWTLRLTVKILPWKPTARFTGISVYRICPGGSKGVHIVQQTDYWDSINAQGNGTYAPNVDKRLAVQDFLAQLAPAAGNMVLLAAPPAGPELPYTLLRRAQSYEVRRYPAFCAVQTTYNKRDEGFLTLGSLTRDLEPLSPAILNVYDTRKTMTWPLRFVVPGSDRSSGGSSSSNSRSASVVPSVPTELIRRLKQDKDFYYADNVQVLQFPERVMAVRTFSESSVERVVRRVDAELRQACRYDGLLLDAHSSSSSAAASSLQFAQYDAVYSVGERRSEVWIELPDGLQNPWTRSTVI